MKGQECTWFFFMVPGAKGAHDLSVCLVRLNVANAEDLTKHQQSCFVD